jgi:uncharacterized hydrophobic protein (TIGR00271 family)
MNSPFGIYNKLKEHLDLTPDKENETTVIENVKRAVEFRGVNLWILIIAVLIASIGLNINSLHLIIGAMLISPLMGPIIGTGLAVGINDMELMKRSMRNLLIASLFAIIAASFFFWLSPLNEAQSELLARSSPTLYDVIIAFIGGGAGFLALSTIGSHTQVIVGVAISTALLPPLCTVGFGIATGNWLYSLGALYLFFINSVFIAISTFISVKMFNFSQKVFADKEREKKVRRTLIIISIVTLLPSLFLTYNILRKTIYMQNAERFVIEELKFPGTYIIEKDIDYKQRRISAVFIGDYIQPVEIEIAKEKLPKYKIAGTELNILQDGESHDSIMLSSMRNNIIKEFYQRSEQQIANLEKETSLLRDSIAGIYRYRNLDSLVYLEAKILFPQITDVALGYIWSSNGGSSTPSSFAQIQSIEPLDSRTRKQISQWMRQRCNDDSLRIEIVER